MQRGKKLFGERRRKEPSPLFRHSEVLSHQGLGGGRAQGHDQPGMDQGEFRLQPWMAGVDLPGIGFLMQPPFSPGDPFEMFDGVGEVKMVAVNAEGLEAAIQQPSRRTHERTALFVLLVPGDLPHNHDGSIGRAFAENSLSAVPIERAILAGGGLDRKFPQPFLADPRLRVHV